jgi:hypothetical protein
MLFDELEFQIPADQWTLDRQVIHCERLTHRIRRARVPNDR